MSLKKTDDQILYAFGVALVSSGLKPYITTWEDLQHLVDDEDDEKFSDYFSDTAFNEIFVDRFLSARIEAITQAGWNDGNLDRKLFRTDPKYDQSFQEYYTEKFYKSIKGK